MFPAVPTQNRFWIEVNSEVSEKIRSFMKTLEQFNELRNKLSEMLDEAITSGKVTVKTPRDIQALIEAYSKLAETEGKLATAMTQLLKAINERDALTVAVMAKTESGKVVHAEFNPKALVPVIEVSDTVDDNSG